MNEQKHMFIKAWPVTLLALALSFSSLVAAGAYRYGVLHDNAVSAPSISVSGEGEATASPDIATMTFIVSSVSPTVKEAQKKVEDTMAKVTLGLKGLDVATKDIKTENYSVNPKYTYSQISCYTSSCQPSTPKLEGYEVAESVSVKVRKLDSAGEVLALLGKNEVTNIQGPNFSIENTDALIKTARASAIEKAAEKAKETAKSLGVSLGDLKSYNEGGSSPYPMMYAKGVAVDYIAQSPQEKVTLAQGETKVTVTVNLVYSLR